MMKPMMMETGGRINNKLNFDNIELLTIIEIQLRMTYLLWKPCYWIGHNFS